MRVIILLIIFFYKNLCFFAYADIIETSFLTKEEIITSIDVENRKNLKKKLLSITKEDLLEIPLLFPKPKT